MAKTKDRIARWAFGTSDKSVQRALDDVARLNRGHLNEGDSSTRYTLSGPSRKHYDTLRFTRDDLDYREWNQETGYWGIHRWPSGPGEAGQAHPIRHGLTEAQKRRRERRVEIEEGF